MSGRTRQFPAGDQLDSAVLANAIAVVLAGLVTSNRSPVVATDTVLQAIGKLQAQASAPDYIGLGPAPDQLPAGAHLGALAFVDDLGALAVLRHTPDSVPGQWWREWGSDMSTIIKFHGFDGVVRDISEVGPQGAQGIQGAQGLQGVKGDAGATGSQGIQGVKGDTGAAGSAGVQGLQGPKGDTGAQGIQGPKGDPGATGATGAAGAAGTFDTGQIGAAPDQVPSVQQLGRVVFLDNVGVTTVQMHVPDSQPGDMWSEYVSNTQTIRKFHGFDGVVRSITETWA